MLDSGNCFAMGLRGKLNLKLVKYPIPPYVSLLQLPGEIEGWVELEVQTAFCFRGVIPSATAIFTRYRTMGTTNGRVSF